MAKKKKIQVTLMAPVQVNFVWKSCQVANHEYKKYHKLNGFQVEATNCLAQNQPYSQ